jgi:Flp pilus assembly protein TadD
VRSRTKERASFDLTARSLPGLTRMPTFSRPLNDGVHLAATIGLFVLLPVLTWHTGRTGFASLLSTYAARTNQPAAADAAATLSPGDPEGHYIRGAVLEANDELAKAISEYTRAVALRPDDYVLWLALAHAAELNGETDQAILAAKAAVPLAPFYAQPHWQLGNILVRAGQRDEGFKELRLAGASDPTLFPIIIDLAWQLSRGDIQLVKQAIQPQSPESFKALADYFMKRNKTNEAIEMLRAAGGEARPIRRQYLNELISGKQFREAHELWAIDHGGSAVYGLAVIVDPGFEQESDLDEPGFGWRSESKSPSLSLSLDPDNPNEGHSSLRVEFKGDSDPGQKIVSQLVLLEPRARYQLEFAARTDNVISGGLPNIAVTDASDNVMLGQPVLLPKQTDHWQHYRIDFSSREKTAAIQISLRREGCSTSPCPIFGRLWLDNFFLQKL